MNIRIAVSGAMLVAIGSVGLVGGPAGESALGTHARPPGPVPLLRQVYRNNCETAALAMVLGSVGVDVDQRTLQQQVRRSGPLDPIVRADGSWIWGNPEKGFVGRPAGGGTAGGFGVYQRPIRDLAARYRVALRDLSRKPARLVFRELTRRRPVIAWIGLSAGPYRLWETPAGKRIRVNFGEHVVVLTGVRGDEVSVNDPLTGTRLVWSRREFLDKWALLGRRALALA